MAAVQVWFYSHLTEHGLPKEPALSYAAETVGGTNVAVSVPASASVAVVETDAATAYRANAAAVLENDPQIAATGGTRYAIECGSVATLNFIST